MRNEFNNEDFRVVFRDSDEQVFWDHLLEVKNSTKIVEGETSSLSISPISPTDPESLRMAPTETRMKMHVNGQMYPVYGFAMMGIKRRALVDDAQILKKMSGEDFCSVLNLAWPYLVKSKYKALIRGCGLHSLMSDRYVPISQWNMYRSFKAKMEELYPNARIEFLQGEYSHSITKACFAILDEDLLQGFKAKLTSKNFPTDDLTVIVNLITSDVGECSVTIAPAIKIGKYEKLQFAVPFHIPHRDDKSLDDVVECFDKVFLLVKDGLENMERLVDIQIDYPVAIASRLVNEKSYRFPKLLMDEVINQYKAYEMMGEPITAMDFYRILSRTKNTEKFESYTEKRKLAIEDTIARVAWMSEKQFKAFQDNGVVTY